MILRTNVEPFKDRSDETTGVVPSDPLKWASTLIVINPRLSDRASRYLKCLPGSENLSYSCSLAMIVWIRLNVANKLPPTRRNQFSVWANRVYARFTGTNLNEEVIAEGT